jgi:hypothetical protein
MVLTARRAERLEALAAELRAAHGGEVQVVPLDLAAPDAAEALFSVTEGADRPVDILISNAGLGVHGEFLERAWADQAQQLRVNTAALTELAYRFGAAMRSRRRGHLLHVASFVSELPVPGMAVYAATKAYVRSFTDALAYELSPYGVKVASVNPGGIDTEFFSASGQERIPRLVRLTLYSPSRVARAGLGALFGYRRAVIPGLLMKLGLSLVRLMPRRLRAWLAARVMGRTAGP